MINCIAQVASFVLLLLGTLVFGILGKPTEMGLCIAAASIGLAFSNIEKMKKFKAAGFEAEMLERKVDAIVAKDAEPEPEQERTGWRMKAFGLDESTRIVLKALGDSRYTWRTVRGIAHDSGMLASSVNRAMEWLNLNELVVRATTGKGVSWGLSEEGRNLYNSIAAEHSPQPGGTSNASLDSSANR